MYEGYDKFNEASGVISYFLNEKVYLNELGIYSENIDLDKLKKIESISPNFTTTTNESIVAKEIYSQVENIKYDNRIGYFTNLYIGYVKEGDFRKNGSSGGLGTWILYELFKNHLVDGVIHVKKSLKDDLLFEYSISSTINDVFSGAKTKYYPVELSGVLRQIKDNPGKYAVVGIPSFIYALRLISKKDKILNESLVYFVGLICGHQKSAAFTEYIGWQLGFQPKSITNIDYRKKIKDRPANQYGIEVTGIKNGKISTKLGYVNEIEGLNWGQGWFKTSNSDFTDDVFNETADIVLGDAWLDEYNSDYLGNNIVIVRNPKILELIISGINDNRLNLSEVSVEKIFKSQSSHYLHTYEELPYRLHTLPKESYVPKKRVGASNDFEFSRKIIQKLRKNISESSHDLWKEAKEHDNYEKFFRIMVRKSSLYTFFYKLLFYKKFGLKNLIIKAFKKYIC